MSGWKKPTAEFQESTWNMALGTMLRLDKLLQHCHEASMTRNYLAWHNVLTALHRELFPFAGGEERAELSKLEGASRQATGEFSRASCVQHAQARSFGMNVAGAKCYASLDKFEKSMRNLMQAHGLLLSQKESLGDAMLR